MVQYKKWPQGCSAVRLRGLTACVRGLIAGRIKKEAEGVYGDLSESKE